MSDTTKLTEIVTGLGTLGADHPLDTLPVMPGELRNVSDDVWAEVTATWNDPAHRGLLDAAFENGQFFLSATEALRGRRPRIVEWTGPQRSPGDEVAPVDLRVDHVYLISCKYLSKITMNASPAHLFERLLTGGHGRRSEDWYRRIAPVEYQALWDHSLRWINDHSDATIHEAAPLSRDPEALSKGERKQVSVLLRDGGKKWPVDLQVPYQRLCGAVATSSAQAWRDSLAAASSGAAEAMLWRLLRIGSAPYFVLGAAGAGASLRFRVASPWDWRQSFQFKRLEIGPVDAGQPTVSWLAVVVDKRGADRSIRGHVEIRWSHGRFSGPPEAKVYLDTPFTDVAGYWPLV